MNDLVTYLRADVRRVLRNRRILLFGVALPSIMLMVYGGTQRGTIRWADSAAYIMVSMAIFGAMSAAVGTGGLIATERSLGWNRTLRLTPLRPGSYVAARVVLSMLLVVPPLVVVYALGAAALDVRLSAAAWVELALASSVGALPFAGLGLVIGYAAEPDSVQQVGGLVYVLLSLFGGLWIPVEAMPDLMRRIAEWTPVYWVGQLARSPIFPGQTVDWRTAAAVAGWTLLLGAIGYRRFRADTARA